MYLIHLDINYYALAYSKCIIYITYWFNISVFQRKHSTSKNSKIEKYMFFDDDNIKHKDKKDKEKEKELWIVWWDQSLNI